MKCDSSLAPHGFNSPRLSISFDYILAAVTVWEGGIPIYQSSILSTIELHTSCKQFCVVICRSLFVLFEDGSHFPIKVANNLSFGLLEWQMRVFTYFTRSMRISLCIHRRQYWMALESALHYKEVVLSRCLMQKRIGLHLNLNPMYLVQVRQIYKILHNRNVFISVRNR
jgi:hypothetical protein